MTWYMHTSGQVTECKISRHDRPVVVVDPEKIPLQEFHDDPRKALEMIAEDVRRVGRGDLDATEQLILWLADQLPKPEEPTRPGAMVKDANGVRWVSWRENGIDHHDRPWQRLEMDADEYRNYSDISVVEVLFEGDEA